MLGRRKTPRRKKHPVPIPQAMEQGRTKDGVFRDDDWKALIRSQKVPCAVTGRYGTESDPVVGAHVGITGKGCKAPDYHILPMLDSEHKASHGQVTVGGFVTYWCNRFQADKHLLLDVLRAYAEKVYRENNDG